MTADSGTAIIVTGGMSDDLSHRVHIQQRLHRGICADAGELTGLPVYDLHRVSDPQPQREVIFLGWLMAGNVKGYAKADRLYKVRAVCQVGMGPATKAASDKLRQKLKLSPEVQVFTLQGGFDIRRLHGPYKWIMQMKCRDIRRTLEEGEPDPRPAADLRHGHKGCQRCKARELDRYCELV